MPPVPKPPSERRRRNVTGVKPDHILPVDGRTGPVPDCPIRLGSIGMEVWRWLWHTPQATKWHGEAAVYPLARLAMAYEELITEGTDGDQNYRAQLQRQIETSEDKWGLNPKAMAALHWFFGEPAADKPKVVEPVTDLRDRVKGIVS